MHIVPAPAESLMKSRVLSIPGLQGVMDTGFSDFTQVGAVACGGVVARAPPHPPDLPSIPTLLGSFERPPMPGGYVQTE